MSPDAGLQGDTFPGKSAEAAGCSFCRKSYRDVGPLVEGPGGVRICRECIELCRSTLDIESRRRGEGSDDEGIEAFLEQALPSAGRTLTQSFRDLIHSGAADDHLVEVHEIIHARLSELSTEPGIASTPASSTETIALFDRYVIPNYRRYPVYLVRGEGSQIWDAEGNRYLDFFPGWGCNLIGHCPPRVVEAVREQVGTLIHVPNTWYMETQGRFAQLLSERSFGGQCFFANSGAEANEAAIKLARAYGHASDRTQIITMYGGFHGRTYAALSATAQPKYHAGFEPLVPGFTYVPYDDLDAAATAIDDRTAAVLVEPIQGEGGVRVPSPDYLAGLRRLCDERGALLMLDEVQTGMGRTGRWFAYQHAEITPDVLTCAKALAGGVACGVMIARQDVAVVLQPGMHASTFGGNPIACRAGIATVETIEEDGLLDRAEAIGARFRRHFEAIRAARPDLVRGVRIVGAMIGLDLAVDATPVVSACLERRLLVNATGGTVVRLLPALTISDAEIDEGCAILADVLSSLPAA
jgi:acetylornithine/N-succinyldiaminopimelate aminotransferase